MKFTNLEVDNFLTIKRASILLDGRGLNVIQGANDDDSSTDSNGAGKSSLVDALCWALFGVTARGVKGDAVVNITAKKECRVAVYLANGDSKYSVVRHRKHKEHKNALRVHLLSPDGTATDLSKGTDAETQKDVEKILGCSQEVFLAAVYSGQELMPDLPKMTDRELKSLIEEAAGLRTIEMAYEESRARRTDLSNRRDVAATHIDNVKSRITRDEGALMVKAAERDAWDTARGARLEVAAAAVKTADEALHEAARKLLAGKPDHSAQLEERSVLGRVLDEHTEREGAVRALERAAAAADAAIDRAGLANARSVVTTIQAQIDNAAEELAKPCPECGKPHTADELAEYIAHRTKRLGDAQENAKLVAIKVQGQAQAAKKAKDAAEAARAALPDVTTTNARIAELGRLIAHYESAELELRRFKGNADAARAALAMREGEVNPIEAVVATLQERIATDTAELAAREVSLKELTDKLAVAEAVVKVFGPAGVRAHILDTVTPFLNDRTADYLSALSDGAIHATWSTLTKSASGDLKEKFSIEVTNDKGGDSFLALSGGEKRKVRLATALALQDLVASRAAHPIDLWVGDEVDDALDPAGLERLMTILERKARERGTVLVISHNNLSDWCDQVTTVRKSGGVSHVEGALCS